MGFKPIVHSDWGLKSNGLYNQQIEIFIDRLPQFTISPGVIKIVVLQEPTMKLYIEHYLQNHVNYDYIFTYFDSVLERSTKAVKFLCINSWIKDYTFPTKSFAVSTLVGGKNYSHLSGHKQRHELWGRQEELTLTRHFFLSTHTPHKVGGAKSYPRLGASKDPLFNYQYHIVIENDRLNNMFTEKVIDCFQTKTIPIYLGAPNIGEYFNVDGMVIANDVDDLITKTNALTPDFYESKAAEIEENYQISMRYLDHTQLLDEKLTELFPNEH